MRVQTSGGFRRGGKILVLFVMTLTVLLGMVGLVIDSGLLMAAHREAQNAADSAALAAAMELFRGESEIQAQSVGTTFVKEHNGHANATVTMNFGAAIGGQAASQHTRPGYVEAVVDLPVKTYFIQMFGVNRNLSVRARAVAGFESLTTAEGVIVLDPRPCNPGLSVSGGAVLHAQGPVIVNARGKGIDQYGVDVPSINNYYAVATGNNSRIYTSHLQVVGGVDSLANIYHIDEYPNTPDLVSRTSPHPLFARAAHTADPLRDLPVPQVSGQTQSYDPIKVNNGETRTLTPGIYSDIQINEGATAVFQPGIYVLAPTQPNQGLRINGGANARGEGVMFYLTGSNYLSGKVPGFYDIADGRVDYNFATEALPGPPPGEDITQVNFATLDINASGGNITLTGIQDTTSPYNGILFFQRRRNESPMQFQSNSGSNAQFRGTVYAKWANLKLAGGGRYNGPFIVGSMDISGNATVIVENFGGTFGLARQVFLVE